MLPLRPSLRIAGLVAWLLPVLFLGCAAPPTGLEVQPIGPQFAFVGAELRVPISVGGASGPVRYRLRTDVPDLCHDGRCRAGIEPLTPTEALLRWVPREGDVGAYHFEVEARDGVGAALLRFEVEVRSSVGYEGLPRFVQPLGTGTTLDFGRDSCFEIDVVIDDPDSREVEVRQEPPRIAGATLEQHDGFSATWRWCPEPAELRRGDHRRVHLSADDGVNPATRKDYLLVMRRAAKPDCEGKLPEIRHAPPDAADGGRLRVEALVEHEHGLKHPPLLYYSMVDPGPEPDLSRMVQITMAPAPGTTGEGLFTAMTEDLLGGLPEGSTLRVHYLITATATDERNGPCDFHAQAPEEGTFAIELSRTAAPAGDDPGAACDTCTDEPACGEDDEHEPNGSLALAAEAAPLPSGAHEGLVSCAGTEPPDEDWYRVLVQAPSRVLAAVHGGYATDLDLALVDGDGTVRTVSESTRSTESVAACLPAGDYFLRVFPWGRGRNDYRLDWEVVPGACGATCEADRAEPDDTSEEARRVSLAGGFLSRHNTLCGGSDDWYAVHLEAGQTLGVELSFVQTAPEEDLDLHFLDAALVDWTPCTEEDPSTCWALQGQSVDSNEYYDARVEESGTYYVVVHGFDGAENLYDIRLWLIE